MSILVYFIPVNSSLIHPIQMSSPSTLGADMDRVGVEFVRARSGNDRALDAFTRPETTGCYLTRLDDAISVHMVSLVKSSQSGGWFGGASTVTYEPQTSVLGDIRHVNMNHLLNPGTTVPSSKPPPMAPSMPPSMPPLLSTSSKKQYENVIDDLKRFIDSRRSDDDE